MISCYGSETIIQIGLQCAAKSNSQKFMLFLSNHLKLGCEILQIYMLHIIHIIQHCHRFWHATLRLLSAICRQHSPQRAVLSQICCFGERKVVVCRILLDGAEPRNVGTSWLSSPVCRREANRILLVSALSSMHAMCSDRVFSFSFQSSEFRLLR